MGVVLPLRCKTNSQLPLEKVNLGTALLDCFICVSIDMDS